MHISSKFIATLLATAIGSSFSLALAQTPPDAGQLLDEMRQSPQPLPSTGKLNIQRPQTTADIPPGGAQVRIHTLKFQGMSSFDAPTLLAVLGEYQDKSYDLAGLQELAARITRFYRQHDFPFALAYLPPQQVDAGEATIEIVEGRYGKVRVLGEETLAKDAARYASDLADGEAIKGTPLERTIHLLGELPGIRVDSVLMPGAAVGTGDLEIRVTEGERFAAELGLDNHGNRYTGAWRASGILGINRVLGFGDQLTVSVLRSDEQLVHGQVTYALPLGNSGLRGNVGYSRGDYELGSDFAALGATGTAETSTLGLDYPLRRSTLGNLDLQAAYRHKSLRDTPASILSANDKASDSLALGLRFDYRDAFAGGGVTWGTVEWATGKLSLDSTLRAADATTARTEGSFGKATADITRLQKLPGAFSLFGRFVGQWTNDNLDSSEGFGLGGANGVRAYPQGEAFGDRGWLTQIELRYRMEVAGTIEPYLLYDVGEITTNARPWAAGDNRERISGAGIGIRVNQGAWRFEVVAAWRDTGTPRTDTRDDRPRAWASLRYRF